MPRYDFECANCEAVSERVTPVETRVTQCPVCGGPADRLFAVCRDIRTPRHFQMTRGWHLPKTTEEKRHADQMGERADQFRAQKPEPLRPFLEQRMREIPGG